MRTVIVSGSFDDLRSHHVRFLEEARRRGDSLHVLLWSDAAVGMLEGQAPRFPESERRYLLEAIRFVDRVWSVNGPPDRFGLPAIEGERPSVWAVDEGEPALLFAAHAEAGARRHAFCRAQGIEHHLVSASDVAGFPSDSGAAMVSGPGDRKKVFVTGCFDWLHSGHIRFFEEVSALGDLYVAVGNDASVRYLKGEGHPLFPQAERRYMAGAIRFVKQALITSGQGWMDAAPDIERLKPDIYAVNEDGDRPEKRAFCLEHGLQYVVLKRTPKKGLPRRESTVLRGF